MKSKLFNTIIILAAVFLSSFIILPPVYPAFAADSNDICNAEGVSEAIKEASGCNGNNDKLSDIIIGAINVIMGIIALVAVIAIIISGVQYITSIGDPGKVKKAKETIMYAIIGLIIVGLAATIVNFVIKAVIDASNSSAESTALITSIISKAVTK